MMEIRFIFKTHKTLSFQDIRTCFVIIRHSLCTLVTYELNLNYFMERSPSWQTIIRSAGLKIVSFYETLRFIIVFTNATGPHLVPDESTQSLSRHFFL
jgi:hypothetical protein